MKKTCIFILLLGLAVSGCSSTKGESYVLAGYNFGNLDKVAVLDVSGKVRGEAAKNQISTFFEMELMARGYTVISRGSAIEKLQQELQFQASDITTDAGAARAGQILNVPAVILVDIPAYGENIDMTAKMINVEDGTILWAGSQFGETGKTGATVLGAIVGAAAGAAVAGGDTRDRVGGAVLGGVVGGVAGSALSPRQSEQVQKCVKKICEDFPYKSPNLVPAAR